MREGAGPHLVRGQASLSELQVQGFGSDREAQLALGHVKRGGRVEVRLAQQDIGRFAVVSAHPDRLFAARDVGPQVRQGEYETRRVERALGFWVLVAVQ